MSLDCTTYIYNSSDCKDTTAEELDTPSVSLGGAGIPDETPYATVVVLTGHYYKKAAPHNANGPHDIPPVVSKETESKGPVCYLPLIHHDTVNILEEPKETTITRQNLPKIPRRRKYKSRRTLLQ